ncbi:tail protein X [Paenibacillus sp. FSL H8-0048]|uniref:tail protein X n=1 Tax=Paenibacillus sp. FSL H8-0048 TaxID=2954508 RepID=UPI0030F4D781
MIYRTVQGDMWDGIAFKVYGDAKFMTLLLNANPAHAAVSVFSGNIVLNVPELPSDISSSLPPWRRE